MATALIISAHPDDMEIGMGGSAAKLTQGGQTVYCVVLTDGRRGPNIHSLRPEDLAAKRREEAQNAARVLGIDPPIFFDLPDVTEIGNYQTATQRLAMITSDIQPVEVYTLHPELDRHPTHRAAGSITLEATQNVAATVWAYEVWGLFGIWDRLEDVSLQMELKLEAIRHHQTQVAAIEFADGVRGLNRWRAVFANPESVTTTAEYAEAFIRLRN